MLTALDIIVLLLVGGGAVFGVLRGFVTEVLSLFAWVAAVIALKLGYTPVAVTLKPHVGTGAGAAVLAFAIVFGATFILGKLVARRIGARTRQSILGPIDRLLGLGFGAAKGLIGATLLYLLASLAYDSVYGAGAARPEWMMASRSYPLLRASGHAIVDFVAWRRAMKPAAPETPDNATPDNSTGANAATI